MFDRRLVLVEDALESRDALGGSDAALLGGRSVLSPGASLTCSTMTSHAAAQSELAGQCTPSTHRVFFQRAGQEHQRVHLYTHTCTHTHTTHTHCVLDF